MKKGNVKVAKAVSLPSLFRLRRHVTPCCPPCLFFEASRFQVTVANEVDFVLQAINRS